MSRYPVITGRVRAETEVSGSRFIATVAPAPTETDARAVLADVRAEYPDATHNCWAYVVGEPGSTRCVGSSDDGEPHGTAGRPMLDVLLHCGVGELVVVVTRYFGGRKLGRGGLVRAYQGAVQAALAGARVAPKIRWVELEVEVDYAHVDAIVRALPEHEAELVDATYGARVAQRIRVPKERREGLLAALSDSSRGLAIIVEPDGA